jgi:hypothetical protein
MSVTGAATPCENAVDTVAALGSRSTVLLHKRAATFSKFSLYNSEESSLRWKAKHVRVCKQNFLLKLALFMMQVREAGIIIYFPVLGKNLALSCYENRKKFVLLMESISFLRKSFPWDYFILNSRILRNLLF